jgi:hypothetical protein
MPYLNKKKKIIVFREHSLQAGECAVLKKREAI